ncbi:MAG: hypothetical protein JWQ88_467 [Rhodoferax sp.]|nr:hypothetical protein [Rhodoferax sp.]
MRKQNNNEVLTQSRTGRRMARHATDQGHTPRRGGAHMSLSRLLGWLAALLVVATLALVGRTAMTEWRSLSASRASLQAVTHLRLALLAAEMVSRERGPANGALGADAPLTPLLRQALDRARERTDRAFADLQAVLPVASDAARQMAQARSVLGQARSAVDGALALPQRDRPPQAIRNAVYGMVAVVPLLAPVSSLLTKQAQQAYPELGDAVQAARLSSELREHAGLLGSHFTAGLARQLPFSPQEATDIEQTRGRIAGLRALIELRLLMPGQPAAMAEAWRQVRIQYFEGAGQLLANVIAAGKTDGRYGLDPAAFAAMYVPQMNTILNLRNVLLDQAMAEAHAENDRAVRVLAWVVAGSAALLLVLGGAVLLVHRRVLRPLVQTTRALKALAESPTDALLPTAPVDDEIAAVIGAARALQVQTRQREVLERERDALITQLQAQSSTDFLTGLPNRRAFFAAADAVVAQARRLGFGVAVVVLDIDRFKQLNDTRGHAFGDEALVAVANAVRSALRLGDLAARFGGEEFVVLLSHCDEVQGMRLAERLREVIALTPVNSPAEVPVLVTASLGMADSATHGLALQRLLSQADAAMYRAKQAGRNRVAAATVETTA